MVNKKVILSYVIELILMISMTLYSLFLSCVAFINGKFKILDVKGMKLFIVLILILLIVINYIIRLIIIKEIKIKRILFLIPLAGFVFSLVYINGTDNSFSSIFFPENINALMKITGIILEIIMLFLYNLHLYYYCGSKINSTITLILYNIIGITLGLLGGGFYHLHNYYLGLLILFIPVIIIEFLIRYIINKKQRI